MPRTVSPNRPMLNRLMTIHKRLSERSGADERITAATLAREIEVTPKTIQRDIDYLKNTMGLPIEYIAEEHSLAYTGEVGELPFVKITEGELVALVMAKAALHRYHGLPFEKRLQAALEKIESGISSDMEVDFQELASVVSFRQAATPVSDMRVFETLSEAVIRRRGVTFDYQGNNEKNPTRRTVRPYHLAAVGREWYLLGHDESRDALRSFRLGGMREVSSHKNRPFKMPKDFDPEQYFAGSFGIFVSDDARPVRIRFTGRSAEVVATGQWHPSQKITRESSNAVVLEMTVGSFGEIGRWLLSFGSEAEVMEPSELSEQVKQQCHRILKVYGE